MRIAFGLLSLVVVLAIVGMLAKRSLPAAAMPAPGASAPTPQQITRKVADDVGKLMQQTPARVDGAIDERP